MDAISTLSTAQSHRSRISAMTFNSSYSDDSTINNRIEINDLLLKTCRAYGNKVLNEEFLSLENKNIQVQVKMFKDYIIKIETQPDIKIDVLKNLIYEFIGLPVECQRLVHKGKALINIASLKFLKITEKSIVEIYQDFPTTIKLCLIYQNLMLVVFVSPYCMVKYLKHFVDYKLGIPFGVQVLTLSDNQRLNDDATLEQCGLNSMDEIFVQIFF